MEAFSPYNLVIAASVILIVSFFFGEIARLTSIPSVLLLIVLGIVIKLGLNFFEMGDFDFFPVLEILGIVGLIMIVLEAALELKLEREKVVPILKALGIALAGLLISAWITAEVLQYFIEGMDPLRAWIYATPLSILSSAIIIPSVTNMRQDKKEFHVYESTFSDILGIILFYFLTGQLEHAAEGEAHDGGSGFLSFGLTLLLTIVLSMVFSYIIIFVFQRIKSQVKLFLLIAVLMMLYAIGKQMHLSSLIEILVFGLMIANMKLFFQGPLRKWLNNENAQSMYTGLHEITMETSFVVRTFFFVIFGITITFASLADWKVLGISALLLIIIYLVRLILLRPILGKDLIPQIYIAPRGLITILLFYAIPADAQVADFSSGILLYIILGSSFVMTFAMMYDRRRSNRTISKLRSESVKAVKWKVPEIE